MSKPPTGPSAAQRVAKLLARAGVASRREVVRMIAEGRVALNGAVIDTPATLLRSLAGITVDGNPVAEAEAARLFLYHKPPGLLTTERDPAGRATIYDRLPKGLPRLMPVGRLDLNTEGLLLMTTDGELKRQLELPATGVERAYRARAYGQISQPQLEDLIEGVEIEGVRYGSIDANIERRTGANVWIEMILKEGKNREVRRVLEHLGLQVSRLIRTRYGPFLLGDLMPGQIGEVRRHDVESFRADPVRRDLPQPSRRRAVTPVEMTADAIAMPAPDIRSVEKKARGSQPVRAPRKITKDEPRRRADGSIATRGASGRSERTRSFREARGDAGPAARAASTKTSGWTSPSGGRPTRPRADSVEGGAGQGNPRRQPDRARADGARSPAAKSNSRTPDRKIASPSEPRQRGAATARGATRTDARAETMQRDKRRPADNKEPGRPVGDRPRSGPSGKPRPQRPRGGR